MHIGRYRKMLFIAVSFTIISSHFTEARGTRHNNDGSCVYNFDIWKPGKDAEKQLRTLENLCRDTRHDVTAEMGVIKADVYRDLKGLYNNTMMLQREALEQKVQIMDLQLKFKTLSGQIQGFDKSVEMLDQLALHNKADVNQIRRTKSINVSLPADILAQMKNSMGNLKAEWLLIKRQIRDVRAESYKLKLGQNEIETERRKSSEATNNLRNDTNFLLVAYEALNKQAATGKKSWEATEFALIKIKDDQSECKYDLRLIKDDLKVMTKSVLDARKMLDDLKTETTNLKEHFYTIAKQGSNSFRNPSREATYRVSQITTTRRTTTNRPEKINETMQSSVDDTQVDANQSTPSDCQDVFNQGFRTSGAYEIQESKPDSTLSTDRVYCEMVNGIGWTVIQRRVDGLLHFNKSWLEYKYGFGNIYGEFWLGNERMHQLTKRRNYRLRVDMWDWEGARHYAEYDHFMVENEKNQYRLHVRGYAGNAGDSLSYHSGMSFSTEDVDNDHHARHCAVDFRSGWWFDKCYSSNLNGVYRKGWYNKGRSNFADGIIWYTLKDDDFYSLKMVEMKIRPV